MKMRKDKMDSKSFQSYQIKRSEIFTLLFMRNYTRFNVCKIFNCIIGDGVSVVDYRDVTAAICSVVNRLPRRLLHRGVFQFLECEARKKTKFDAC